MNATGLGRGTEYDIYLVAKDAVGNKQSAVTSILWVLWVTLFVSCVVLFVATCDESLTMSPVVATGVASRSHAQVPLHV